MVVNNYWIGLIWHGWLPVLHCVCPETVLSFHVCVCCYGYLAFIYDFYMMAHRKFSVPCHGIAGWGIFAWVLQIAQHLGPGPPSVNLAYFYLNFFHIIVSRTLVFQFHSGVLIKLV